MRVACSTATDYARPLPDHSQQHDGCGIEVGVMDFEPGDIKEKGRLQPGKILLVDTEKGEIYYDGELKKQLAESKALPNLAGKQPDRTERTEERT